ncbi:NAD(P)-dependent oxidoreductase [Consotaella aegiceratis]|uniref:NAD(P)-dependent oxidoreductase n=1 Tax=Consotaella aegiceratis TaxID=3097961 RepID=UPI002F3FD3B4
MKICILGATGKAGERLVKGALDQGHQVTAIVRNGGVLSASYPAIDVREVDFSDRPQLVAAIAGHEATVNAAGHVNQDRGFTGLVSQIVDAAAEALGQDGRFWMFAGAALLDVPGTKRMTVSLPKIPSVYQLHAINYETVRRSRLDWSVLCPGPMVEAPDGRPHEGLVISTETWPVPLPAYTRVLPWIATSLAFRNALGRMTITYEDAAKVILDNLAAGRLSRCRVGVALPDGMTLSKPGY